MVECAVVERMRDYLILLDYGPWIYDYDKTLLDLDDGGLCHYGRDYDTMRYYLSRPTTDIWMDLGSTSTISTLGKEERLSRSPGIETFPVRKCPVLTDRSESHNVCTHWAGSV